MKAKELRLKTIEELKKIIAEKKEILFGLNIARVNRRLKDMSQYKKNRHLVARALTIIKEKEKSGK